MCYVRTYILESNDLRTWNFFMFQFTCNSFSYGVYKNFLVGNVSSQLFRAFNCFFRSNNMIATDFKVLCGWSWYTLSYRQFGTIIHVRHINWMFFHSSNTFAGGLQFDRMNIRSCVWLFLFHITDTLSPY